MKKKSLLTVLILLTILVNGQVNKLSIGISGSPDFYIYQFKSIPDFDHEYKTKTNYSVGLSMNYNFVERFSLKTRLLFSNKDYILDYHWKNITPNDPLIPLESNFKLRYIDIPILVSYDFIQQNKLSFFGSTGIVPSFRIKEEEISTMGDGTKRNTNFSKKIFNQKFKKTLLALDLEFGLNYKLREKFFVSFSPYLRYGLIKISNEVLETNSINYGTNIGIQYIL